MFKSTILKLKWEFNVTIGFLSLKNGFLNIEIDLLSLKTVKLHDLKCQFQIFEIGLLSLQIGLLTFKIDILICEIDKKYIQLGRPNKKHLTNKTVSQVRRYHPNFCVQILSTNSFFFPSFHPHI